MSEELKPCPMCGDAPSKPAKNGGSDERSGYNFTVTVACKCGLRIDRASHHDKQGWCDDSGQAEAEAIAAWNRRAQPAAPACRICGETEPGTGSCGTSDPRALCNAPDAAPSVVEPERAMKKHAIWRSPVVHDHDDEPTDDPDPGQVMVSLQDLGILAATAKRNGTSRHFFDVALQWAEKAQAEINRLRDEIAEPPPRAPLTEEQIEWMQETASRIDPDDLVVRVADLHAVLRIGTGRAG